MIIYQCITATHIIKKLCDGVKILSKIAIKNLRLLKIFDIFFCSLYIINT